MILTPASECKLIHTKIRTPTSHIRIYKHQPLQVTTNPKNLLGVNKRTLSLCQ